MLLILQALKLLLPCHCVQKAHPDVVPVARAGKWRLVRHWLQAVQVLSLWALWLMLRLMLRRLLLPPHPMQRPHWLLLAALHLLA